MQTTLLRAPLSEYIYCVVFVSLLILYTLWNPIRIKKMWPVIGLVARRYAVYFTLPVAAVVGFIGYHIEGWVSDRHTPATAPITQQRQDRLLENIDTAISKKKHNPLEVNLSPSLSQ